MHTYPADTSLADAIVYDLTFAKMPDGTHISFDVKADAILAHFGITEAPPQLKRLVVQGIRIVTKRKYQRDNLRAEADV